MSKKHFHSVLLERLSQRITEATEGSIGFAAALALVVIWLLLGPILHFSQTWQLFINTTTTTITFLMVFLIERAEKKDAQALHLKLNRIIEKLEADERFMDLERAPESKLDLLEEEDHQRAKRSRQRKSA